jgi:hypothetical protein
MLKDAAQGALLAAVLGLCTGPAFAEPPASVLIKGADGQSLRVTAADLDASPQARAVLTHDGKSIAFDGARLDALLAKIGAPMGSALRGAALSQVVLVKASDGYRVALALSDVDPGVRSDPVILADRQDGFPLGADGPFRLVVGGDLRAARSARSVVEIDVLRLP